MAEGPAATAEQLDAAVTAARDALPGWRRTSMHERGAVLLRAAQTLDRNADVWGWELATEEGKTIAEGIGELHRAAQILRYYGNEGNRSVGELFASPRVGEQIFVTRRPIGVVGVITPFNFPIAIPAWKVAPALIYGNAVVWKPASTVPLLAMRLAEALDGAGLPAGVLNLLLGDVPIGEGIVQHDGIDAISFTGSTGVGRRIAATAGARGVPVQAEMGGKNAAVVLDDADLDRAVDQVLLGAFRSAGQKCTATSRLVVTTRVADRFVDMLTTQARDLVVGDPTDQMTQMGPVISGSAHRSITDGIQAASAQGATVLIGGEARVEEALASGYFIAPTIIDVNDRPVDLWARELFGPVLAIHTVADPHEAFMQANAGEFGLSAAVFTQDIGYALQSIEDMDVGVLHINSESAGADPHVPFGGAKKSGLGPKEQGAAAREFYTQTTTVYLRGEAVKK